MPSGRLDESCRVCGKDANDTCSGCKDALYCSRSCQRWDWKEGGHKTLCRGSETNRKINKILRELFAAEWKWLQGLSFEEKTRLFRDNALEVPTNHLFISGEVALVLARANACAVMRGPLHRTHREGYGFEYYQKVLSPWYTKHMDFLSEQGFFVELISHGVYVSDRECQCDEECGTLHDHIGGEAAIVKDIRSPKIELVNRVFEQERPMTLDEWTLEDISSLTSYDFMECISFRHSRYGTMETGSTMNYFFSHPKQVFGGESVCCSPCFELSFAVEPSDAAVLGKHFHECYEALANVGLLIELLIIHIHDWPDRAVAEAWWEASGKDMSVFQDWFNDGTVLLTERLGSARKANVFNIVLELAE